MSDKNMGKSTSGTAIAGLVLGIVAAVSSWVPIVNNLSFLIGLVGLVLAVVGLVGVMRGKKSGKGMAIAALVVNVAAIVIVLGTQSAMSAAIDEATNGPAVSGVTAQSSDDSADDSADASTGDSSQPASTDLAPGTSVDLANGLSVTVDSVEAGLVNYDGSTVVGVHVTYVNNGEEGASYNSYDWKGENADGAQEHTVYFSEATDDLGYGTLAAGGTKSGTIYFAEGAVKALYFGSPLSDTPTASWVVE